MSSLRPKDSCSTTTPGPAAPPVAGKYSAASAVPSSRGMSSRCELCAIATDHIPRRASARSRAAQIARQAAKAQRRRHRLLIGTARIGRRRGGDPSSNRRDEALLVELAAHRLELIELPAHGGEVALDVAVG